MTQDGYIDYFATLGIEPDAKPGEVKNHYRKAMKALVNEIAQTKSPPPSATRSCCRWRR